MDTASDVRSLHRRAVEGCGAVIEAIADGAWHQPTTCPGWDVRELVAHVVDEDRWTVPLLEGATIADVGDDLAGDPLGDEPLDAWRAASAAALAAAADVPLDRTTHLSFADVPAEEYLWQVTADHLVHGWDLARATGGPEALDEEVVAGVARWFDEREDLYRAAGAIGPPATAPDGDPQAALLARFGRDPSPDAPLAAVVRFNVAFGAKDLGAIRAAITEDCRFVDTTPPDGTTHQGADAVLAAFDALFTASPSATFTAEGGAVAGDAVVVPWRYDWAEDGGGHVRGIDLFETRDGKVAAKASYVKG